MVFSFSHQIILQKKKESTNSIPQVSSYVNNLLKDVDESRSVATLWGGCVWPFDTICFQTAGAEIRQPAHRCIVHGQKSPNRRKGSHGVL